MYDVPTYNNNSDAKKNLKNTAHCLSLYRDCGARLATVQLCVLNIKAIISIPKTISSKE